MDHNPKQQLVERIKSATNILVTVSANPSVDQLSACIGFTLLLNKFGKHATAVFSGKVPSTLEFLQPEKTLEQNTDSLQDFIIALDKSKADKLRYKVEDDVVRIFITPYRTSITEKDLDFSMGDLNVDVVVALGVLSKDDLDQAIVAHGRILHDAVVISVANGETASNIGGINWNEPAASSLSEMLVSVSESFQSGLLDGQMATAFLTGIVAETERFSNNKTSPKVMTMSAQLMAAGANQQLIATELAPKPVEPPPPPPAPEPPVLEATEPIMTPEVDSEASVSVREPSEEQSPLMPQLEDPPQSPPPEEQPPVAPPEEEPQPKNDGEMTILHDEPVEEPSEPEVAPAEIAIDEQGNLKHHDELRVEEQVAQATTPAVDATEKVPDSTAAEAPAPAETSSITDVPAELTEPTEQEAPAPQSGTLAQPEPASDPITTEAVSTQPAAPQAQPSAEPAESDSPLSIPIIKKPANSYVQSPPAEIADNSIQLPPLDPNLVANDVVRDADTPDEEMPVAAADPTQEPQPQLTVEPPVDLDEARKAVNTATLDSAYRPEPVESLGAQFMDTDEAPAVAAPSQPAADTSDALPPITTLPGNGNIMPPAASPASAADTPAGTMPPPPVPPPMTLPFKPKTNHHNPYLQPPGSEDSESSADAAL